jgi:hypothetical protein
MKNFENKFIVMKLNSFKAKEKEQGIRICCGDVLVYRSELPLFCYFNGFLFERNYNTLRLLLKPLRVNAL